MSDDEASKIKIGSKANENVTCAQCAKTILGNQAYAYQGKNKESIFLCQDCREQAERALDEETKNPNIPFAIICGSVAAIVAGIAWSAFTILTGYQIGYIAIGVGFIIGWAVIWGSGQKRGQTLQLISATLTFLTLFISQYFMMMYYYRVYLLAHRAEVPDYDGSWLFLNPFAPDLLKDMLSPMGLVIWGIGIYFAYSIPKSRKV